MHLSKLVNLKVMCFVKGKFMPHLTKGNYCEEPQIWFSKRLILFGTCLNNYIKCKPHLYTVFSFYTTKLQQDSKQLRWTRDIKQGAIKVATQDLTLSQHIGKKEISLAWGWIVYIKIYICWREWLGDMMEWRRGNFTKWKLQTLENMKNTPASLLFTIYCLHLI